MAKNKKQEILEDAVLETDIETDSDLETTTDLEGSELAEFEAAHLTIDEDAPAFLPETDEVVDLDATLEASVEGTELDSFESAEIEDVEFVEDERLDSILESILFASDRPVSLNSIKLVFKGTNIKTDKIRKALDRMAVELAGAQRGITLEEVPGGYQLRTKIDNMHFLTRTLKARPFRLSGPALEVLAIVAYKQPLIKSEIDDIRGVESGHLLRALMEKGLVNFEGKSELPGKPMLYGSTKKFLEIFGLRNLKELPTLSQIDELLPEGMTEEEAEKPTLAVLTDNLSQTIGSTYSEGEEELTKITDQLNVITTSSDFFEQEKVRQKQKRDAEKAQGIRDAMTFGEEVSNRDRNWLTRYDEALAAGNAESFAREGEPSLAEPPAGASAMESASEEISEGLFEEESTDHSVDDDLAIDLHDEEDNEPNGEASI